jgi:hypothetical protein
MGSKTLDLEKKLLGQWNALVRRARIGRDCKVAALTVSSYADPDGTGIRLSVARFAVDLEVSYSTARRYLTWLRKVGLLEMTRAGSRRNGTASEYRLILHPDVMERLDVPSPTRIKELAEEMREANRAGVRDRAAKAKVPVQRSPEMSAEIAPEDGPLSPHLRSSERAQMAGFSAQTEPLLRSPQMTYTPSRTHLSVEDRPSRADDEDLRTAVTDPCATGTEPTNPEPSPRPKKCPDHGLGGGLRPDGRPECTLCRVTGGRPVGPPEPDPPGGRPPRCDHTPLPGKDRCRVCPAERVAPVIQLDSRRTA